MKDIFLVYSDYCISSKRALSLLETIINEEKKIVVHRVPFSFDQPLVKKHHVKITPTFIIDDKIAFVGIPEKQALLEKIN
ncbi:MAG: thioredoxin family protein [Cyanobacteriota bacterium]